MRPTERACRARAGRPNVERRKNGIRFIGKHSVYMTIERAFSSALDKRSAIVKWWTSNWWKVSRSDLSKWRWAILSRTPAKTGSKTMRCPGNDHLRLTSTSRFLGEYFQCSFEWEQNRRVKGNFFVFVDLTAFVINILSLFPINLRRSHVFSYQLYFSLFFLGKYGIIVLLALRFEQDNVSSFWMCETDRRLPRLTMWFHHYRDSSARARNRFLPLVSIASICISPTEQLWNHVSPIISVWCSNQFVQIDHYFYI